MSSLPFIGDLCPGLNKLSVEPILGYVLGGYHLQLRESFVQIRAEKSPYWRIETSSAAIVRQQQEVQELCRRFARAGTSVFVRIR